MFKGFKKNLNNELKLFGNFVSVQLLLDTLFTMNIINNPFIVDLE